jgi:hypothetical protein
MRRITTHPYVRSTGTRNWSQPLSGQRGDYVVDDLPAQEHPVVADAADRYALHFGVGRHRPESPGTITSAVAVNASHRRGGHLCPVCVRRG